MSDTAILTAKSVTKNFNAAQSGSVWKMWMPVFITDVKDNLRPCDSQKVKSKYANAQRKMLSMWLKTLTEPQNMKADYDDLKELLQEETVKLNSPDLVAEGLTYLRMNEILYDKCVQATSQYHPFMVNRIAVDNGLAYLICMRDLVTARGGARLQDALKACRDLKYEGDGNRHTLQLHLDQMNSCLDDWSALLPSPADVHQRSNLLLDSLPKLGEWQPLLIKIEEQLLSEWPNALEYTDVEKLVSDWPSYSSFRNVAEISHMAKLAQAEMAAEMANLVEEAHQSRSIHRKNGPSSDRAYRLCRFKSESGCQSGGKHMDRDCKSATAQDYFQNFKRKGEDKGTYQAFEDRQKERRSAPRSKLSSAQPAVQRTFADSAALASLHDDQNDDGTYSFPSESSRQASYEAEDAFSGVESAVMEYSMVTQDVLLDDDPQSPRGNHTATTLRRKPPRFTLDVDASIALKRSPPAKSLPAMYAEDDVDDLRVKLAHRQLNPFGPRAVLVTRLAEDDCLNGKPIYEGMPTIKEVVEQTEPDLSVDSIRLRIWILIMFVMLLLNHQAMSVPSMLVAGFAAVATQVISYAGSTWLTRGTQALAALKLDWILKAVAGRGTFHLIMFLISSFVVLTTLGVIPGTAAATILTERSAANDVYMDDIEASFHMRDSTLLYQPCAKVLHSLLLDSGCTTTVCTDKRVISSLNQSRMIRVMTGDKVVTVSKGSGTLKCSTPCVATNGKNTTVNLNISVLYMPSFAHSLLSVDSLNENGFEVVFPRRNTCKAYLVSPDGHKIFLRKGRKAWYFDVYAKDTTTTDEFSGVAKSPQSDVEFAGQTEKLHSVSTDIDRKVFEAHERTGHRSTRIMRKMAKEGQLFGLKPYDIRHLFCSSCASGKAVLAQFPNQARTKATEYLERVSTDIAGPYRTLGHGNLKYNMLFVDEKTGYSWSYPIRYVDQATINQTFLQFLLDAHGTPKYLRLDNASTFTSASFTALCLPRGIQREFCQPYRHQQNGAAESGIRNLNSVARTLLLASKLPLSLWPYATQHTTWISNRVPSASRSISPFFQRHGVSADSSLFRTFGSTVYAINGAESRDKLGQQAIACKFLGYAQHTGSSSHHPTALCRDSNGIIFKSRDLLFDPGLLLNQTKDMPTPIEILECLTPSSPFEVVPTDDPPPVLKAVVKGVARRLFDEDDLAPQPPVVHNIGLFNADGSQQTIRERRVARQANARSRPSTVESVGAPDLPGIAGDRCAIQIEDYEPLKDSPEQFYIPIEPYGLSDPMPAFTATELSLHHLMGHHPDSLAPNITDVALWTQHIQDDVWETSIMERAFNVLAAGDQPGSFKQAMNSPDKHLWQASTDREINSCEEKEVWEHVKMSSLPRGTNIIRCNWVFKIKPGINDTPNVYKSRATAGGNEQAPVLDTFAPVLRHESLRLGFTIAVSENLDMDVMDVPVAFLNSVLPEGHAPIYMHYPQGYGKDGYCLRLKKCLYGLQESPKLWNLNIHEYLLSLGFVRSQVEPCLYTRLSKDGGPVLRVLLYVDDLAIIGRSSDVKWCKNKFKEKFNGVDHGPITTYIGLQFRRDRATRTGEITMTKYIAKCLKQFGLENIPAQAHPYPSNMDFIDAQEVINSEESDEVLREKYRNIVASALWIANMVRPEISFVVKRLSHSYNNPSRKHLLLAKHLMAYLAGTASVGLKVNEWHSKQPDEFPLLKAYSDADWASNRKTRKSTSGTMTFVCNTLISWKVVMQKSVALSTMEAEYMALCETTREVMYMRALLKDFGFEQTQATEVYEDNQAAIFLAADPKFHGRAKHIDIQYHFSRDAQARKIIKVIKCSTVSMVADIMTKFMSSCIMRTLHMEAAAYLPLPNVNMLKRPITSPTSQDLFIIDTGCTSMNRHPLRYNIFKKEKKSH